MKKNFKLWLPLIIGLLSLFFDSCKKKEPDLGIPPSISFKTGGNYLADLDTARAGDTVLIGVIADNMGSKDMLSRLIIRRSLNFSPMETIKEQFTTESQGKQFEGDFRFVLQTTGTQAYNFIIMNTHGLASEKTITFTVSP